MIDLLIFSKDRAAQLELLLRSIDTYAKGVFNISILYTFSNDEFRRGYDKVLHKGKMDDVEYFIFEKIKFDDHIRWWLTNTSNEYISFSTDDTLLFKEVDKDVLEEALPKYDNEIFSFRLGYNTIKQDIHKGTYQPPLNIHINHGKWLSWPIACYHPHDNYGYPFGLDLHAFKRNMIQPIINNMEFRSTNELESQLTTSYRHKVDEIRSFIHSVAVNVPVNTVTGVTRAGEIHGISKEEMNKKWLDGQIIDLQAISKEVIIGCHQEINLSFSKGDMLVYEHIFDFNHD